MADPKLKQWVDDQLQGLVGYSEPAVAAYVLAVAKRSKTPAQLASELQQNGLPDGDKTTEFAADLFTKMPRQQTASRESASRQREQAAARLARENRQY